MYTFKTTLLVIVILLSLIYGVEYIFYRLPIMETYCVLLNAARFFFFLFLYDKLSHSTSYVQCTICYFSQLWLWMPIYIFLTFLFFHFFFSLNSLTFCDVFLLVVTMTCPGITGFEPRSLLHQHGTRKKKKNNNNELTGIHTKTDLQKFSF